MNKSILTVALLVFTNLLMAQCEHTCQAQFKDGQVETNFYLNSRMPQYKPDYFQVEVGEVSIYFSDLNHVKDLLTNLKSFRDEMDSQESGAFYKYMLSIKRGKVCISDINGDTELLSRRELNAMIKHLSIVDAIFRGES
jgi:hypothetical protein